MNIQSGYGVSSYQGIDRVGSSKVSATGKSTSADPLAGGGSSSSTQVSISDAARKLESAEGAATRGRTAIQQQLINSAASDPQGAEKIAYAFANISSQIAYDISDYVASGTWGPLKLAGSGRIVDDAFKDKFSKEASLIDSQKKAIYETEKAKGTPDAEIFAKLIDFTNSQSSDYLEGTGWLARASA